MLVEIYFKLIFIKITSSSRILHQTILPRLADKANDVLESTIYTTSMLIFSLSSFRKKILYRYFPQQ